MSETIRTARIAGRSCLVRSPTKARRISHRPSASSLHRLRSTRQERRQDRPRYKKITLSYIKIAALGIKNARHVEVPSHGMGKNVIVFPRRKGATRSKRATRRGSRTKTHEAKREGLRTEQAASEAKHQKANADRRLSQIQQVARSNVPPIPPATWPTFRRISRGSSRR